MPIINNKLAQIITGIKHQYNIFNSAFKFGSSGRNNKTHCRSFSRRQVLFIEKFKEEKKNLN